MDEKTREKIFEPFFTTKEVGKGTGLGLSIVYGIVKQHDGFINCYSEPGMGATFRIYLPIVDRETRLEPQEEEPRISMRGTETILLAEDEESVRNLYRQVLEDFGYRVIEAANGEEALSKFGASGESIDLALLDVIMPGKNGRETYEGIKKIRPDIKAAFLSGYPADHIRGKGVLDEDSILISKPLSPATLLRKVRQILDANGKRRP